MSQPHRTAADLIGEARERVATCLDVPVPLGDPWTRAARDLARASRTVGDGIRAAMKTVHAEIAAVEE